MHFGKLLSSVFFLMVTLFSFSGVTSDLKVSDLEEIAYLKKAIAVELEASVINDQAFLIILQKHRCIANYDDFAADCKAPPPETFIKNNGCICKNPDFCDYSCEGSFSGRCINESCPDLLEEDSLCLCLVYPPCWMIQSLFGCFLPCGYTKNCCCEYSEGDYSQEKMRNYLKALQGIYESLSDSRTKATLKC